MCIEKGLRGLLFNNLGKVVPFFLALKNQLNASMPQPGGKKDLITFADQAKLGVIVL